MSSSAEMDGVFVRQRNLEGAWGFGRRELMNKPKCACCGNKCQGKLSGGGDLFTSFVSIALMVIHRGCGGEYYKDPDLKAYCSRACADKCTENGTRKVVTLDIDDDANQTGCRGRRPASERGKPCNACNCGAKATDMPEWVAISLGDFNRLKSGLEFEQKGQPDSDGRKRGGIHCFEGGTRCFEGLDDWTENHYNVLRAEKAAAAAAAATAAVAEQQEGDEGEEDDEETADGEDATLDQQAQQQPQQQAQNHQAQHQPSAEVVRVKLECARRLNAHVKAAEDEAKVLKAEAIENARALFTTAKGNLNAAEAKWEERKRRFEEIKVELNELQDELHEIRLQLQESENETKRLKGEADKKKATLNEHEKIFGHGSGAQAQSQQASGGSGGGGGGSSSSSSSTSTTGSAPPPAWRSTGVFDARPGMRVYARWMGGSDRRFPGFYPATVYHTTPATAAAAADAAAGTSGGSASGDRACNKSDGTTMGP